jgi:hypothetical protein
MTEIPTTRVSEDFNRELGSFFRLCLLSLVFGSLAMAFGMQSIVSAVLAMAGSGRFEPFLLVQALMGWAAAAVGFRWILSSARVLKGVARIRREYRAMGRPVPVELPTGVAGKGSLPGTADHGAPVRPAGMGNGPQNPEEALTGLIIRAMAHYRDNWKTIWRMNLIAMVGGCIFIALGVMNLAQGIAAFVSGTEPATTHLVQAAFSSGIGRSALLSFLAAGINLATGVASILIS